MMITHYPMPTFEHPLLREDLTIYWQALSDSQRALMIRHIDKARQHGVSEWGVRDMAVALARYLKGDRGLIDLLDTQPISLSACRDLAGLDPRYHRIGEWALSQLVCIKLNGGLGTTMGCRGPKSLVPMDGTRRFIDMVMAQLQAWRLATGAPLPMVLLNSFYTMRDTMAAVTLPHVVSLMQHQVPRLRADSGEPFEYPADPSAEWNPPGHGDLFHSLYASGQLDRWVRDGFRYAFVSNIDNVAATIDPALLGYMIDSQWDMMMEVTPKCPQDRKGGSVAMINGRLSLLERSQVPPAQWHLLDRHDAYPWFNTNSIWVDLRALATYIRQAPLTLPLLVNPKTVHGQAVVQLETAMGSAIAALNRTGLVSVGRHRFLPVKTTADLVVLRSNCVTKQADGTVSWQDLPVVSLSSDYNQMDALSTFMPCLPDLSAAQSLQVNGPVSFHHPWAVQGSVTIHNPSSDVVPFEGGILTSGTYTHTPDGWVHQP